jgi:Putative transposase
MVGAPSVRIRPPFGERAKPVTAMIGAYQNKVVIYDLLFKASAETTLEIAATPRHLGARIGFMSVLHTWGSALTHPHLHMVVPGGGLSRDGSKWIACRPRYFLPVEVLSALFRRLFLEMLVAAHDAGRLQFFGDQCAARRQGCIR